MSREHISRIPSPPPPVIRLVTFINPNLTQNSKPRALCWLGRSTETLEGLGDRV